MGKINIWVSTNEFGMLTDYSLSEKKDYQKIEVTEEPVDYLNWGIRNGKLVHYPKDLNNLTNNVQNTSFEGNVLLIFAFLSYSFSYIPLLERLIFDYPKYNDILEIYDKQGPTKDDVNKFVQYNRITEEEYIKIIGEIQ